MSMSADQFQQFLQALPGLLGAGAGGAHGSAVAVGPMETCNLGINKVRRYKEFSDWLKEAETKIEFMGITEEKKKISLLRSWAGKVLLNFWDKEVRISWKAVPAIPGGHDQQAVAAVPADSYDEIITKTKAEIIKHVNRDRSIIDLLHMRQQDDTWMAFISELEDAADLCQLDTKIFTRDDAIRVAALSGMKDRSLAEKALAEKYSLQTLISVGSTRETSKATAEAMAGKGVSTLKRIPKLGDQSTADRDLEDLSEDELDRKISALTVMKLKRSGKYSVRFKNKDKDKEGRYDKVVKCNNCRTKHEEGRCPARGKECFTCEGSGHFSGAASCPETRKTTTKRVEENQELTDPSDSEEEDSRLVRRVDRWPGVRPGAKTSTSKFIGKVNKAKPNPDQDRWVRLRLGGKRVTLFSDTGSKFTLIPPELYDPAMGKIEAADSNLRAWGSKQPLDVKGMFTTEIVTKKGARKTTVVYVVAGHRPEPLLGDSDATDLGIIEFRVEGREPTQQEMDRKEADRKRQGNRQVRRVQAQTSKVNSIPQKIRDRLDVQVLTSRLKPPIVSTMDMAKTQAIIDEYTGSVFTQHVGLIKTNPVKLEMDPKFKPTQPPHHQIPLNYRHKVSKHLQFLREEGVITDVDPRQAHECVLNVVITDKTTPGEIRMNIDSTPQNPGMRRTKFHVKTPQEIRHELEGATVFSEMDMIMGFHQLPLHNDSKNISVFQTHEGLHRMERVYFGPTSSSGIFHHEVMKALRGVEGCTTLHDNILVYGRTHEDHRRALRDTLERCKEKGITLHRAKGSFCKSEVNWFGRVFSSSGVSADPRKIEAIIEAGRPTSTDEVRSLIQAAAYNARFAFDHKEDQTYEEATAPLRELMGKDSRFSWNSTREQSYQKLMRMMSSDTTLRPYCPHKTTHFVSDASPRGIAASLYQEGADKSWVPVDHISRALSKEEMGWMSQIDWESLAKSWGMEQFRYYLTGIHFTSWGDQEPLVSIYNNSSKAASVRISKHRMKVQDLCFKDKYMPGRRIPCDYNSRHPQPIQHLSQDDRAKQGIDDGEEIFIRRVFMSDLPDAVTVDMLKEVAERDPSYISLREAVLAGKKTENPAISPYTSVWPELGVVDSLVCRGDRIVVPSADLAEETGNIRTWLVDIAHDGHHGEDAMKRCLRARLWFPGMDKLVKNKAAGCHACQATVKQEHRDPLQPTTAPHSPWQKVAADHWGPTPDKKYLLVLVDHLTKYPEIAVVKSTSAADNMEALDSIFARHGNPKVLFTDNGAPFNGGDRHELQQYFKWAGIIHKPNRSAEDPEANGLAEAFMKHCKKIYHTAIVEKKHPVLEINKHLRVQRATPHPTTGFAPAELLFGRKFVTRLPDLRRDPAEDREDIKEARDNDKAAKEKQKRYKDAKRYVKPHNIKPGDEVLMERDPTKSKTPYDPKPYTVIATHGTQITGRRGSEEKTRDAQKFKKVKTVPRTDYDQVRAKLAKKSGTTHRDSSPDIGPPVGRDQSPVHHPPIPREQVAQEVQVEHRHEFQQEQDQGPSRSTRSRRLGRAGATPRSPAPSGSRSEPRTFYGGLPEGQQKAAWSSRQDWSRR